MKRWMWTLTLAAGAALPVLAEDVANAPKDAAADQQQIDRKIDVKLPDGIVAKELKDQDDELTTLATAIEAALTKDGFDDLTERFSTVDRKRIGDFADQKMDDINAVVARIDANWKQKYGESFKLDDEHLKGFVTVMEGEVSNPATARMHWPVAAIMEPVAKAADEMKREGMKDVPADAATSEYLDQGRNVALVAIPGSHGLPAVTISLYREAVDDWRIDIPDNVTGEQIKSHLLVALNKIDQHTADWPAEVNQARHNVAHCVLMSLYGVDAPADHETAGTDTGSVTK